MICPLLGVCGQKISMDHYRNFCTDPLQDSYKKCLHYQEATKEPKTPIDWQKLLLPPPTRT